MLSNTCKYGIRAVIYLAQHSTSANKIGIKKISEDLDIPTPFLGKILQMLAKHKMLSSTKGPHGGFSLGKNADKITMLDVIEIIDGLDYFHSCIVGLKICNGDEELKKLCPIHERSGPIRDNLFELYKKQTIIGLAKDITDINLKFGTCIGV